MTTNAMLVQYPNAWSEAALRAADDFAANDLVLAPEHGLRLQALDDIAQFVVEQ